MPRPSRPWFRSDRDAWYAWIEGRRVKLADGKDGHDAAMKAFYKLKAAQAIEAKAAATAGMLACEVANMYYLHAQRKLAPLTAEFYGRHLRSFIAFIGDRPAAELRPKDVVAWIDSHPDWGVTTQAGAITAVKRAFRWAARQGHLENDPILAVEKPTAKRREKIMDEATAERVIAAVKDGPFRDLLTALHRTGARPSELMKVRAADYAPARCAWVFPSKTTARTGRPRVIYLTGEMREMHQRLAAEHPDGPLFRNTAGEPWTRNAMACRFARLRAKLGLGKEATAESFRHQFATDHRQEGTPDGTTATLMGHSDTAMLQRNYSHLDERDAHCLEAIERIRGRKRPP
jgi:integrase